MAVSPDIANMINKNVFFIALYVLILFYYFL